MIYVLMIALVVLLWISFIINKKDLIAPSFVFCASFCFSSIWAVAYAKKWDLGLHTNTFCVIIFGVLEFIIVCGLIQSYFFLTKGNKNVKEKIEFIPIKIENWKKILFLIFCIFNIFYTLRAIINAMNGSWSNISSSIYSYRKISMFSDKTVTLPKLVFYFRYAVNAAGYWFSYILINNYFVEKKVDILTLFIVIASMISNMTMGGRGGAVNLILGVLLFFCLLLNKKTGFYKSIRFKTLIRFIIIAIIALSIFQATGSILGRNSNELDFLDYLSVYCGAEIKNLDLFLQENYVNYNVWGSQTFIHMIKWIGPIFGIKNINYQLTLPYRKVHGISLGNVYTTFYPFIYDFGYTGVVFLVCLMAIIVQAIYERCKRAKLTNQPTICIIIYGYLFNSLVLSFFSNKFYEQNFNKQFVYAILFWEIYNVFFCRVKLRKNNSREYRDEKNKRI